MDEIKVFVKLFAVDVQQRQEKSGSDRTNDESHHAKHPNPLEHGEEHHQVVHAGVAPDEERFEDVVDAPDNQRRDEQKGDALPDLPARKETCLRA